MSFKRLNYGISTCFVLQSVVYHMSCNVNVAVSLEF